MIYLKIIFIKINDYVEIKNYFVFTTHSFGNNQNNQVAVYQYQK